MKLRFFPLACISIIFMVACSSDLPTNEDNKQTDISETTTDGLTAFNATVEETRGVIADTPDNDPTTRTAASYNGKLNFTFYTGDRVWINTPFNSQSWQQDSRNTIRGKTASATFYFPGAFDRSKSYKVRYTGTGNASSDKITIAGTQGQTNPNDATQVGASGDCATGVATFSTRYNRWNFSLDRKASYLTFAPRNAPDFVSGMKLIKIKVSNSNSAMSGTFNFNDNGIVLSSRPGANAANKSITLNVSNFEIPQNTDPSKNAAVMVLAPGNYSNVTIEYTIYDRTTGVQAVITKSLSSLNLAAGTNHLVTHNMAVQVYGDSYYMWDAKQEYWYGHKSRQPKENDGQNNFYPKGRTQDPTRWFSIEYFNGGTAKPATASAKDCPNVNMTHWYVESGEQYWDNTTPWAVMGHLYKGGMWIKTEQFIKSKVTYPSDLNKETYNGYDFTTQAIGAEHSKSVNSQGKPSNIGNYFYLPALGYYNDKGRLQNVGKEGYYWTSSPTHNGFHSAYALNFKSDQIRLYGFNRGYGFPLWVKH